MDILLSFDTEEFDVPREHGVDFTLDKGVAVSVAGTERILQCLKDNDVKATFFCTANFVKDARPTVMRIIGDGHEIACHGVDHWHPQPSDVADSKRIIEELTGQAVYGYRQPRMFRVDNAQIRANGYRYNSSLNPAFIPGRYMHLAAPRTWFVQDGVVQVPASVTPWLRIPLFWLSLHHMPQWLYHFLVKRTLRHDGYFTTYFHPWEFCDLGSYPEYKIPYIIRRNSGIKMVERLGRLIKALKKEGAVFTTYNEFLDKTL